MLFLVIKFKYDALLSTFLLLNLADPLYTLASADIWMLPEYNPHIERERITTFYPDIALHSAVSHHSD